MTGAINVVAFFATTGPAGSDRSATASRAQRGLAWLRHDHVSRGLVGTPPRHPVIQHARQHQTDQPRHVHTAQVRNHRPGVQLGIDQWHLYQHAHGIDTDARPEGSASLFLCKGDGHWRGVPRMAARRYEYVYTSKVK